MTSISIERVYCMEEGIHKTNVSIPVPSGLLPVDSPEKACALLEYTQKEITGNKISEKEFYCVPVKYMEESKAWAMAYYAGTFLASVDIYKETGEIKGSIMTRNPVYWSESCAGILKEG